MEPAENKEEESRRNRFLRIAEKRTKHVLEKIRILGNCSNRSSYEYTQEDVDKIFKAIERQIEITRAQFEERRKEIDFKLR